jgi:putative membrane protein
MAQAIAAYLHYLSIFVLFALLSVEHIQFKLPLDLSRARSLIITDIAYGISAGVVLVTGAARAIWYAKGPDYYLHNSLFHAKVGLFLLIALLSIVPTLTFVQLRKNLHAGLAPEISPARGKRVINCIRAELLLLLSMPLLAVFMARGYGVLAQ